MLQIKDIRKEYRTGDLVQVALGGVSLALRDNEFVAVLEGSDFMTRGDIMSTFNDIIDENNTNGGVVVSAGISDFVRGKDNESKQVFDRADRNMYRRKKELKKQN